LAKERTRKTADVQREPGAVIDRLARYISSACTRTLPAAVTEKAKAHILDTVAAMVSGTTLAPGQAALRYVAELGGRREATVIGSPAATTAVNAALANGMLAHADETDDSHARSLTHPGCAVVPAALAMAERQQASGPAFIRSVVLGYDICARTTLALGVNHLIASARATHAIGGTFGAAAAAGSLARLKPQQARYLISYAVQQTSGVYCWIRDQGHIEKAFDFGGMPARNGVTAATMVASGMTGVDDPLSGERNFFMAFAPQGDPEQLVDQLGERFEILDSNIKKWSVGSPNQAILDALEALLRDHPIDRGSIARVDVEIPEKSVPIVDNRAMPAVCAQHLAAVMIVDGTVTFAATHDVRRMKNRTILAARQAIHLVPNASLPHSLRQAIVTITLQNGQRYTHRVEAVRGTAQNPMSFEEVAGKAVDLIAPVTGSVTARRVVETIASLDRIDDMRTLRTLLTRRTPASKPSSTSPRRRTRASS
jgi:2-methylcitrate dehydratase PrpD